MKKIATLFIVLLVLLSQIAATSAAKLVRLDVINASGDTVYLKLEATVGDAFYYLTIPDAESKSYTIETDLYKRTTWACGYTSAGLLAMTSNVRLKFTTCNQVPTKRLAVPNHPYLCKYTGEVWQCPNYGEPTQEKVSYFKATYGMPVLTGGCAGGVVAITFKSPAPYLCYFRYRY